jgi:hypothetical protein
MIAYYMLNAYKMAVRDCSIEARLAGLGNVLKEGKGSETGK